MECWEEVDLASVPAGHTLLDSDWVYKIKYKADADGNMTYDKHRARLVATGLQQRKGIDYPHSFSPRASYVTIRLIMAVTAIAGFVSYHLDATCAFISARLPPEEQVFTKAIAGFPLREGRCLKLSSHLSVWSCSSTSCVFLALQTSLYQMWAHATAVGRMCLFSICTEHQRRTCSHAGGYYHSRALSSYSPYSAS